MPIVARQESQTIADYVQEHMTEQVKNWKSSLLEYHRHKATEGVPKANTPEWDTFRSKLRESAQQEENLTDDLYAAGFEEKQITAFINAQHDSSKRLSGVNKEQVNER